MDYVAILLEPRFGVTRYKGRASVQILTSEFPHAVKMVVPLGGLGNRLDAMYEFHSRRGIKAINGPGRRENERDVINWRFKNAETAIAFADEFNGTLIMPPTIL
jgi:hypothetical protein